MGLVEVDAARDRTRPQPHRFVVLAVVLAGLLAVNWTYTIFAVALTRIGATFHTSESTTTWVLTAPLLCFAVAAPVLGKLGDRVGHRRVYLCGTLLTIVAALLTATAPSFGVLVAARALSGLVGAATGTASMAIVLRAFDQESRVKAMGWWSLVGAGGPVLGVVIGGVLIDDFGWRSLFLVQGAAILLTTVLAAAVLPRSRPSADAAEPFDLAGAGLLAVACLGLLLGLNRGPASGWASPLVLCSFAAVPAALYGFASVERRAARPVLPLHLVRKRNFGFAIANQFFANFAYMGGFILSPLLLERVFGDTASAAGLTVIARPLVFSIAAPLAGYAAARTSKRLTAVAGGVTLTASMAVFVLVTHAAGVSLVVVGLALSGLALGLSSPAASASAANEVEDADLGMVSSTTQLMSQLGTVAGIQVLETVQAGAQRSAGVVGSFHDAFVAGIAAGLLATACAAGLAKRRVADGEPDPTGAVVLAEEPQPAGVVALVEA